ncbi:MAG: HpaII family restriction endonuclease [Methanosphaera sp.]|nr:HpaII family restriction endonuclease [Methanosphaera sp.]
MFKYNKGEWSELYVIFKLLHEGHLLSSNKEEYTLRRLYKEEENLIFECDVYSELVYIYEGNYNLIDQIDREDFGYYSSIILEAILNNKHTFEILVITPFLKKIGITKIKSSSRSKKDIKLELTDPYLNETMIYLFNIKSDLGSKPTLLNASSSTNFVYKLDKLSSTDYDKILSINKEYDKKWVKKRISLIKNLHNQDKLDLSFKGVSSKIFKSNLKSINKNTESIFSYILLDFYSNMKSYSLKQLTENIINENPLKLNLDDYKNAVTSLLNASLFGMMPSKEWSRDYSNDGIIIVNKDGNIYCMQRFHDSELISEYLYNNTKLETASTSRYNIAKIYQDRCDNFLINLNLQIRMT